MKLVSFSLENFRCFVQPFTVNVDSFTALVGRNDVGKSALLEALSIFFDQSKLDTLDASVNGNPSNVRITCEFSDLPATLVLDTDNPTSLEKEYLLNSNGKLEIVKVYDASGVTPRSPKIFARANHPSAENFSDLLSLKRADLLKRADALGVDLEGVNRSKNAELRAAIWEFSEDLILSDSFVDLQKETGKQAWTALSNYLPSFWLFKSDRASTDQDDEAQDPLNAAISEAVKAVEGELNEITERVRKEVAKVAKLTLEKVSEMDAELSQTLDPVVRTKKWESIFQTSITGDHGIPLNKRGSGVRRLILLNFFRAQIEAKAAATENGSVIYAVEEPETSQHPRNQRLLLSTLQRLTADPSRQVIVTTHTPMLARAVPEAQLRFIHDEGPHRALAVGGGILNERIAKSLGVLADHSVKAFVGVEGPNDISFLTEISKVLNQAGEDVPNLELLEANGELIFIPLGGSCLALWADRLRTLNRPELHICDRDSPPDQVPKYAGHVDAVNARAEGTAFITNKREMENYIHPQAIVEAYEANGVAIELPETFDDFDDVPSIVARTLHETGSQTPWEDLSEDKQKKKCSRAKKILNGDAARRMSVERLQATGGYQEVCQWLGTLHQMVQAQG